MSIKTNTKKLIKKPSLGLRLKKDMRNNWGIYILVLPVIAYYLIFHYIPLYGAQIAFRDFVPAKGIAEGKWVGFKHFLTFIKGAYFSRVVGNTFIINILSLLFAFPAPIVLALLLNELRWPKYKKSVQTISYLPHFISMVVAMGMVKNFCSTNGLFNDLSVILGNQRVNFLQKPEYFRTIYILSDIWQGIGWGSIIYIAALTNVDSALYEAASIDGAGRFKKLLHVTLPSIAPTIIIMLIMRVGSLFSLGYEKTILLYSPSTYKTADIISSYVYRVGLTEFNYSYSAAVGLMNSVVNFLFVFIANMISRKVSEVSLW